MRGGPASVGRYGADRLWSMTAYVNSMEPSGAEWWALSGREGKQVSKEAVFETNHTPETEMGVSRHKNLFCRLRRKLLFDAWPLIYWKCIRSHRML